jgi:proline dehydrogenase
VKNAEKLINLSYGILGPSVTNALMRRTFFAHFCAGTDSVDMKPVIAKLEACNVKPILDYAAESEGSDAHTMPLEDFEGLTTQPPFNQPARIYDYKSEKQCDHHVEVFKKCIRSVRDVSPHGFAALKVTALGNPALLERMSTIIVEVRKFFASFDEKKTGFISREDFLRCYDRHFHRDDQEALDEALDFLDPKDNEMIDYISFAKMLTPYTLSSFTLKCREIGPLAKATPSDDEIALMAKISERLHVLAEEASRCGTKLLIDAEHQKYQPAIDSLCLELQQKFNAKDVTDRPVIFNTYQCYLKDMPARMVTDLRRSERFDFHFAAKLVRGAYMVHERERAEESGRPSPVHDTIEDTHRCYDESVRLLLEHRKARGPGTELMIASHNKRSIETTVRLMEEMGLDPSDGAVYFAQLYGMADNLTFTLGLHGYNAFKYLPYGEVHEVLPYLLRRAQENGDMLGNAGSEVDLLKQELKKRISFA